MESDSIHRNIVKDIRRQIEDSKGTYIWSHYVNALKLIAQVVFTRSSGFVLELIQNAEDAGQDLDTRGIFELRITSQKLKIVHNGRPFSEEDVRSVCGIRSSKKPERGTLGYLGIGFKSVFKVTDCPEVYSAGFQFKFDRNYGEWSNSPGETPWHIIPIWLEKPSEAVAPDRTTFIIPFREESQCNPLRDDVKRLKTELYLFLRWLKEIRVCDEVSGESWTLKNDGEDEDGITTLSKDGRAQRFKFFHGEVEVPDYVKVDRLTQEYRANVARRAIGIAFALDENGNLDPSPLRAMYGGVYSFLPLGEARSGAKFAIQADFLVQPGREAINYEALWNHWLLDEVVRLCKTAIGHFKQHKKWRFQFLRAFEFDKFAKGHEAYDKLFGPRLVEPLEDFLKQNDCVPVVDGSWAKPDRVVRIDEDQNSISDLSAMGILREEEVAAVMVGKADIKASHPNLVQGSSELITTTDRWDLLTNDGFLQEKAQDPNSAGWFRSLYLWLQKHPSLEDYKDGRRWYKRPKRYDSNSFVLTADGQLLRGGEVSIPDLPPDDPIVRELSSTFQLPKSILHPDILAGAKDEDERKAVRGFLTGLAGVQIYDSKSLCRDVLLPRILAKSPRPSSDEVLRWTVHCQHFLGRDIVGTVEFWVLTKQGDIRPAKEVLFSTEFKPETNWESNQSHLPGVSFVSEKYLEAVRTVDELRGWREFMRVGGVKDKPDDGVEEFAVNFSEAQLKACYTKVIRVEKLNYGYDLEAETATGKRAQIEVKGQSGEEDVVLTGNETDAADRHKETYHLCVVSGIPERPQMHLLSNPSSVGKKDKLTILVSVWKAARWP